jgi:hypothetical protein
MRVILGGIDGEDSGAGGERSFQESTILGDPPQQLVCTEPAATTVTGHTQLLAEVGEP